MPPQLRLRLAAGVGAAGFLLTEALSEFPQPRQMTGFVVLVIAAAAVALTLRFLLPAATARLLRHPDLVVPLGLVVLGETLIAWLPRLPVAAAFLTLSWTLKVGAASFAVSVAFVLSILLWAGYGTWMTVLILQLAREGRDDPVAAWSGVRRWFGRVLGLEFVGWGVLFLALAVVIPLAAGALPLALLAIGGGCVLWNLATAALLPVALDGRLRFGEALGHGIRVSWRGKARWWPAVVAQLLLLGLVTFVSVSHGGPGDKPGSYTRQQKTSWAVNAFWTGGYENECRWYGKLMEALEAPKLKWVSTALGLTFGVLAIVVKIHIVGRLMEPSPPLPGESPEGLFGGGNPPHTDCNL